MATYEIHGPLTGDRGATAEALKVLSAGFCYGAFVFGPFWLAAHRLWAPLTIYLAAAVLTALAVAFDVLAPGGGVALELAAATFLGLQGATWQGDALTRRGLPLLGLVEAGNATDAADLYILRALPGPNVASAAAQTPRYAPTREREVLGLFPEANRT